MKQSKFQTIQQKLVPQDEIPALLEKWKGEKIVFTNGCFDILHYGHIYLLSKAADLGDKLIVGLNSDTSTSRLKGPARPINNEESRATVIAALEAVDAVIIFEEDTPLSILKKIRPNVLVKGGDYNAQTVVGADLLKSYGGEIIIIDYIPGNSTTSIEEKIKNS